MDAPGCKDGETAGRILRCSLERQTSMAPATSTTVVATRIARSYMEPLLAGDRNGARQVIDGALDEGHEPLDLLNGLIWPTMEMLQSLYREDRITKSSLNLATRLNRAITDQLTV